MIINIKIDFSEPPVIFIDEEIGADLLLSILDQYNIKKSTLSHKSFKLIDVKKWLDYIQPHIVKGSIEIVSGKLKDVEPKEICRKRRLIFSDRVEWVE